MNCLICAANCSYYFSKVYTEPPFNDFMREIGKVDYCKCDNCGFVLSQTHSQLDTDKWVTLNHRFHNYIENPEYDKKGNQPPYAQQAMMISFLATNGIINATNMVDYAAGYGTLSNILKKYYNINLPLFDPYIQDANSGRYINEADLKQYETVINSAMFEHVLTREDLDRVNNTVAPDGSLVIHTVVCESIPADPEWFYLRPPVHTAFHTNKSMEILMGQWGYKSSIYCPPAKCWILLRNKIEEVENKIKALNNELQTDWFYCKDGFMDYWKIKF